MTLFSEDQLAYLRQHHAQYTRHYAVEDERSLTPLIHDLKLLNGYFDYLYTVCAQPPKEVADVPGSLSPTAV